MFIHFRGDLYSVVMMPNLRVSIQNDGFVYHAPYSQFEVFCNLDLHDFPFDEQICKIQVRNWNIPSNLQHFALFGTRPIKKVDWVDGHLWDVPVFWANISTSSPDWEEV